MNHKAVISAERQSVVTRLLPFYQAKKHGKESVPNMKKILTATVIILILLFSFAFSAVATTTDTKRIQYDDAIFELAEKLALWENQEEATETRDLERMREVFANMSGVSAQFSKGYRQYIEVLINIAYESYDSLERNLNVIKLNTDFCKELEKVHKVYVHIGTIDQLENYAIGRKNQYLGEEAARDKSKALQFYQEAISAYSQCNGWLDSAQRIEDLKGPVNEISISTDKNITCRLQNGNLLISGKGTVSQSTFSEDKLQTLKAQVKTIVIEYGITKIGPYAFQSFGQLTSVEIPSSVTAIEDSAFENCSSLTYVTIPESVKTISGAAFRRSGDHLIVTAARGSSALDYCKKNGLQYIIDFDFVPYNGKLGDRSYPVYSAPDTNAYRAVNGNASCDTSDSLSIGGYVSNGWVLIQYDTNNGDARVGYLSPNDIKGKKSTLELPFCKIQQKARQQLQVTDNPSIYSAPIGTLRAGDAFSILGQYTGNIDWWYIECKINGKTARGFIRKEAHPLTSSTSAFASASAGLQPIGTVTVDGYGRYVRKDAGTEYEVVATVNDGETYYLYDYKTAANGMTWCYINVNGKWGWISKGALRQ